MGRDHDKPLIDEDAGPLVRPYLISGGRTAPTTDLDLITLIAATGKVPPREAEEIEHAQILRLCQTPISVAEISGLMKLHAMVVKVLVSDLLDREAVTFSSPELTADVDTLEALLNGLQRRL